MRKIKLKIREYRDKKGWSVRKLARESGLTNGYISELESEISGKNNPSIKTICKIAKALGVNPCELFECD